MLLAKLFVVLLPPGLPPVSEFDLQRFPQHGVKVIWDFSFRHLQWVDAERSYDKAWHEEALYCEMAWYHLVMARHYATKADFKRSMLNSLGMLREHIGMEAYYRGQMPPFAPYWRFRTLEKGEQP